MSGVFPYLGMHRSLPDSFFAFLYWFFTREKMFFMGNRKRGREPPVLVIMAVISRIAVGNYALIMKNRREF